MKNILNKTDKIRESIRNEPHSKLLTIKPFAAGMYSFVMVMISYYSRVREKLKIDYDSFMVIQTVVSHSLYHLNKKKTGSSYYELEKEWEKLLNKNDTSQIVDDYSSTKNNLKLTISSICLVTSLPKETVRRKVSELVKKNLLDMSKKDGVLLGSMYKKVFSEFTPHTTLEVSKMIKSWEKNGILKSILNFSV